MLIDDNEADNEYHELVINATGKAGHLSSITDSRKVLECWKENNAMEELEQPMPDLVFLDINMPAYNGFELLDRIEATSDPKGLLKSTKIFILTTSQNPDDFNRAKTQYGHIIKGFYTKPLSAGVFENIVANHF